MATARTGAEQAKNKLQRNNSGLTKILNKTAEQNAESKMLLEKDYKGWKVHSKNLKSAKTEYLKNRNETLLKTWQTACDDAQKYIDEIEGGVEQHNTKIKLWKKLLTENRWDIHVEYLIKAEYIYKKNKDITRWEMACQNARDFINQIEPLCKKITIKPEQVKAWKDVLIAHSQRIFKANQEISKKAKSKAVSVKKNTAMESKVIDSVEEDKNLENFLHPESTPLLKEIDDQLSTAAAVQSEIQRIHEVGTQKIQEMLMGDSAPEYKKPVTPKETKTSHDKTPEPSPRRPETPKNPIDPKIAATQQKINDVVVTLTDNPTLKETVDEFKHMNDVSESLDKYANRFAKKPAPKEESGCCCACWPFFKRKKISDEEQYSYQRLPSSPRPKKS